MAVKDGLPSTDFSRMNREYIKAVAGESGGGLPEITEADEGKVLTVESGEAAWATASGGESNVVLVTLTYDEVADDGTYTSDKNLSEIVDLIENGKIVILTDEFSYFPCNIKPFGTGATGFTGLTSNDGMTFTAYSCDSGNTWASETRNVT